MKTAARAYILLTGGQVLQASATVTAGAASGASATLRRVSVSAVAASASSVSASLTRATGTASAAAGSVAASGVRLGLGGTAQVAATASSAAEARSTHRAGAGVTSSAAAVAGSRVRTIVGAMLAAGAQASSASRLQIRTSAASVAGAAATSAVLFKRGGAAQVLAQCATAASGNAHVTNGATTTIDDFASGINRWTIDPANTDRITWGPTSGIGGSGALEHRYDNNGATLNYYGATRALLTGAQITDGIIEYDVWFPNDGLRHIHQLHFRHSGFSASNPFFAGGHAVRLQTANWDGGLYLAGPLVAPLGPVTPGWHHVSIRCQGPDIKVVVDNSTLSGSSATYLSGGIGSAYHGVGVADNYVGCVLDNVIIVPACAFANGVAASNVHVTGQASGVQGTSAWANALAAGGRLQTATGIITAGAVGTAGVRVTVAGQAAASAKGSATSGSSVTLRTAGAIAAGASAGATSVLRTTETGQVTASATTTAVGVRGHVATSASSAGAIVFVAGVVFERSGGQAQAIGSTLAATSVRAQGTASISAQAASGGISRIQAQGQAGVAGVTSSAAAGVNTSRAGGVGTAGGAATGVVSLRRQVTAALANLAAAAAVAVIMLHGAGLADGSAQASGTIARRYHVPAAVTASATSAGQGAVELRGGAASPHATVAAISACNLHANQSGAVLATASAAAGSKVHGFECILVASISERWRVESASESYVITPTPECWKVVDLCK